MGHRGAQTGGGVGDDDPLLVAGLEIHRVVAGTEPSDVLERCHSHQLLRSHSGSAEQQKGVEALEVPGTQPSVLDIHQAPLDPLLGEEVQADVSVDGGAIGIGAVGGDG